MMESTRKQEIFDAAFAEFGENNPRTKGWKNRAEAYANGVVLIAEQRDLEEFGNQPADLHVHTSCSTQAAADNLVAMLQSKHPDAFFTVEFRLEAKKPYAILTNLESSKFTASEPVQAPDPNHPIVEDTPPVDPTPEPILPATRSGDDLKDVFDHIYFAFAANVKELSGWMDMPEASINKLLKKLIKLDLVCCTTVNDDPTKIYQCFNTSDSVNEAQHDEEYVRATGKKPSGSKSSPGSKAPGAVEVAAPGNTCLCGCGESTPRRFKQGHDARARSLILKGLRGGLTADEVCGYIRNKVEEYGGFKTDSKSGANVQAHQIRL